MAAIRSEVAMPPLTLEATVQPGGTIVIDHLPFADGETVRVEIVRTHTTAEGGKYPLRGTPGVYLDPYEPACDVEDWEALK
jgi:hypothetical protein